MDEYQVAWERRAERKLRGLPRDIQRRMVAAVGKLAQDPRPRGAKKLAGRLQGLHSIRVGIHYRVAYEVSDKDRTVRVVNVGSREEIY